MVQPRTQILRPGSQVLGFTPAFGARLIPNLAMWGIAAGGALLVVGSSIPLFKNDVLIKVPFVAEYYSDRTPDSDKPFFLLRRPSVIRTIELEDDVIERWRHYLFPVDTPLRSTIEDGSDWSLHPTIIGALSSTSVGFDPHITRLFSAFTCARLCAASGINGGQLNYPRFSSVSAVPPPQSLTDAWVYASRHDSDEERVELLSWFLCATRTHIQGFRTLCPRSILTRLPDRALSVPSATRLTLILLDDEGPFDLPRDAVKFSHLFPSLDYLRLWTSWREDELPPPAAM
ncbi:hypothetical protein JCM11641_001696 [Rhodosporidiobolus odoratus]